MSQSEMLEYLRKLKRYANTKEIMESIGNNSSSCIKGLNTLARFGFIKMKKVNDGRRVRNYYKYIRS